VKIKQRKLKAIDLFAGAGGFSLGLQQAEIDVIAAVEKDKMCCSTLEANKKTAFPKMRIIQKDITQLRGYQLLREVGMKRWQLDILVGGPPCQGFSTASSRRSVDDPRSKMMWEFIRMTKEIKPRYFLVENVPRLLSFKDFFRLLLRCFEKCGYVVRFNMLDCASYGVPQRRKRILIAGARRDLRIAPVYPVPIHFDLDKEKKSKAAVPLPLVAQKCFAVNGFTKEEVNDVWFNEKLGIMMNKKTATESIEQAVRVILLEALLDTAKNKPRKKSDKESKVKK